MSGERPFTLVLDDPAGNSFVESPSSAEHDPLLSLERYERSAAQAAAIGLLPPGDSEPDQAALRLPGLPEIAEDDVHHGAAPIGAAAAHRGLARCGAPLPQLVLLRFITYGGLTCHSDPLKGRINAWQGPLAIRMNK